MTVILRRVGDAGKASEVGHTFGLFPLCNGIPFPVRADGLEHDMERVSATFGHFDGIVAVLVETVISGPVFAGSVFRHNDETFLIGKRIILFRRRGKRAVLHERVADIIHPVGVKREHVTVDIGGIQDIGVFFKGIRHSGLALQIFPAVRIQGAQINGKREGGRIVNAAFVLQVNGIVSVMVELALFAGAYRNPISRGGSLSVGNSVLRLAQPRRIQAERLPQHVERAVHVGELRVFGGFVLRRGNLVDGSGA